MSVINDDVFIPGSVPLQSLRCALNGSRERLNGHGSLQAEPACPIADEDDASGDFNRRRFLNERGKFVWSVQHARLLLNTPSSRAYGLKTVTSVNLVTAFIAQRSTAVLPDRLSA